MGVQNLWLLLAPVGRQIEIESLAGQVLAVDASIWLVQFVKAMRDDEGNMIRNAHLLGTFHRVAKLLYYGVRPVFVFDGGTPEIKKKTTGRRRKRHEQQTANLRHTAQRILLNRLKQQRQEEMTGSGGSSAVASGFRVPEIVHKNDENDANIEVVERKKEEKMEWTHDAEKSGIQIIGETVVEQDEKTDDLMLDNIDLETTRLSKIDLHAVFSMPSHLQKDMIQQILRDRRQKVRNQFIPLAGNPEKYSHTQISSFLQTSALNRRIEAVKQQKREEEMKHQGGVGQGRRIDSNNDRFYIYQKDTDRKTENDQGDEDVVVDEEDSGMAEKSSVTETTQPYNSQLDACKPKRKWSIPETLSVKPAFDAASEITAAWIARHQVRVKQEPMLAIEKRRLNRLSKTESVAAVDPGAPDSSVKQLLASDVSVPIKVDDTEPEEMIQLQKLLLASRTTSVSVDVDDKDDDVDWEEVDLPIMKHSLNDMSTSEDGEQKVSNHAVMIESSPFTNEMVLPAAEERMSEEGGSSNKLEWEDVEKEVIAVNVTRDVSSEQSPGRIEDLSPDVDFLDRLKADNEVGDVENSEELFVTLRDEMEDAKAHEDLDILKDEALQSAMVTASNLTQWAAGAVRRALQAHSLQNGRRTEARESPVAEPRRITEAQDIRNLGTTEASLQSSSTEKKFEFNDAQRTEVVGEEEDIPQVGVRVTNAIEGNEEQLHAALAASIANDQEEVADNAGNARARYLEYSRPSESPQLEMPMDTISLEMDPVALRKEQLDLKKLRCRQLRDTEGITDEMVAEVMELLRLFGVPFLVSPMEAEAQCAALEQLGLVDGVVTDDSDIFPFGGQRVYKNIFNHQKFIEAFSARDIECELGFSREQIIALALLLGSDYTDGVRGIGIVNATEIAASYPGIDGLREFKAWVREFNVAEEAQRIASSRSKKKVKKGKDDEGGDQRNDETARECFQRSHATARRKWEIGDEFPSQHVVQAYMAPQVDRSDARFSWSAPDLAALRNYCTNAFGWDQQKSDGALQPLEEKAKAAAASGSRRIQTRLDRFFTSYDDQVHYAQIKSKRLRSAVSHGFSSKSKKRRK